MDSRFRGNDGQQADPGLRRQAMPAQRPIDGEKCIPLR
jgi:hypothetical protein